MTTDIGAAKNDLDLPAGMFRIGKNKPEDFSLFIWHAEKKENETVVVADQLLRKFDEIGGNAFFEGDILIGNADLVRGAEKTEAKGLVIMGDQFRWHEGRVKYLIAAEFLRAKVELAIEHWQEHTPFRFIEIQTDDVTPDLDHISFQDQGGCFSAVGRQGGVQTISLGAGCGVGSAIHEIGHSIGLWHEQGRSDRDNFIKIIPENIRPNARHNFDKHVDDGRDVGAYDFGSIMHYPPTAFSINGKPTILTRDGESIGQRNGLSEGDIAAIKAIYPDLDWV